MAARHFSPPTEVTRTSVVHKWNVFFGMGGITRRGLIEAADVYHAWYTLIIGSAIKNVGSFTRLLTICHQPALLPNLPRNHPFYEQAHETLCFGRVSANVALRRPKSASMRS